MFGVNEGKAVQRRAPRSGNVQIQAYTATATAATPFISALLGKWLTVTNLGPGNAWVLVGSPTMTTVDSTATSGAALGKKLAPGQTEDYELDANDTHFSVDGDAAGTLEWVVSGD